MVLLKLRFVLVISFIGVMFCWKLVSCVCFVIVRVSVGIFLSCLMNCRVVVVVVGFIGFCVVVW